MVVPMKRPLNSPAPAPLAGGAMPSDRAVREQAERMDPATYSATCTGASGDCGRCRACQAYRALLIAARASLVASVSRDNAAPQAGAGSEMTPHAPPTPKGDIAAPVVGRMYLGCTGDGVHGTVAAPLAASLADSDRAAVTMQRDRERAALVARQAAERASEAAWARSDAGDYDAPVRALRAAADAAGALDGRTGRAADTYIAREHARRLAIVAAADARSTARAADDAARKARAAVPCQVSAATPERWRSTHGVAVIRDEGVTRHETRVKASTLAAFEHFIALTEERRDLAGEQAARKARRDIERAQYATKHQWSRDVATISSLVRDSRVSVNGPAKLSARDAVHGAPRATVDDLKARFNARKGDSK